MDSNLFTISRGSLLIEEQLTKAQVHMVRNAMKLSPT